MTDDFTDCIAVARAELLAARKVLTHEIRTYPSPISGCDAQFNHFLAERRKVLAALRALEEPVFIPTPRAPSPDVRIESR